MRRFVFLYFMVAAVLVAPLARGSAPAAQTFPTPPPVPPAKPVAETMFGTSVTDPYRYFENMKDPVVVKFFKEQNAYTRMVLSRLGAPRDGLFERIKALDNTGSAVSDVTLDGPYYFYEKLNPGDNSPKLYVRNAAGGAERVFDRSAGARDAGQALHDQLLPSVARRQPRRVWHLGGRLGSGGHPRRRHRERPDPSGRDRPRILRRPHELVARRKIVLLHALSETQAGRAGDRQRNPCRQLSPCARPRCGQDTAVFGYDVNPACRLKRRTFPSSSIHPPRRIRSARSRTASRTT